MRQEKASGGKRRALIVLCVVLGILLALLLGITVFAHSLLNKINYVGPDEQETMSSDEIRDFLEDEREEDGDATDPEMNEDEVDWGDANVQIATGDDVVNILLIGQDRRSGETRTRSDSMILCTFNTKTKTLTLTSFMRDLYVRIPGYGSSRLNHSYAWGGMKLLNETLEYNFGIHVDGNVEVDFTRFSQLVDLLGGVEIELRSDEANLINSSCGGSLKAGICQLDGEEALCYARIRKLDGQGDFGRTNRQRKVISSLLTKFKDSSLTTILNLLNQALPMITTDLTQSQIVGYVTELFPLLTSTTIVSQRVPADGMYSSKSIDGMAVLVADMDATRQMLLDTLGE